MDTATPLNVIVEELGEANDLFREIAIGGGFSLATLLILIGALLIVFSVAVFGYLTLGAVVDLVVPE